MAEYSIRLNLGGSAVANAERLAAALGTATANASALQAALGRLGSTSASANMAGTRRTRYSQAQAEVQAARSAAAIETAAATKNAATKVASARTAATIETTAATRSAAVNSRHNPYTRNPQTMYFGAGGTVGGFSWRGMNLFTPDAGGKIMGMDAATFSQAANVTGVATQLAVSIGKTLFKLAKWGTIAPVALGGGGLLAAMSALSSSGFEGGVRLISRRNQARLSKGAAASEQIMQNADFLATSYGLDRSAAISGINVLAGAPLAGNFANRISIGQATRLTKIGGLISQQSGAPFEKVMTNLQQLLLQTVPNIRDIKELLNQAPILSTYALKDMEARGITGMDTRTYLKDQQAIKSTLQRYELENASNAGMRARGQIALAKQDAWANVASNDAAWATMGNLGANFYRSIGEAGNSLLTAVSQSQHFKVMVETISGGLSDLSTNIDTFFGKLTAAVTWFTSIFGYTPTDAHRRARESVGERSAFDEVIGDSRIRAQMLEVWRANGGGDGGGRGSTDSLAFDRWLQENGNAMFDAARGGITSSVPLISADEIDRRDMPFKAFQGAQRRWLAQHVNKKRLENTDYRYLGLQDSVYTYTAGREKGSSATPATGSLYYDIRTDSLLGSIPRLMREAAGRTEDLTTENTTNTKLTDTSDQLSGVNRDRKSLTINFNAPLVEWNSNISSDQPAGVVAEVRDNIEQIASDAVQKALLGATNKMSNSWL